MNMGLKKISDFIPENVTAAGVVLAALSGGFLFKSFQLLLFVLWFNKELCHTLSCWGCSLLHCQLFKGLSPSYWFPLLMNGVILCSKGRKKCIASHLKKVTKIFHVSLSNKVTTRSLLVMHNNKDTGSTVYIACKLLGAQLRPFWIHNSALFVQFAFFLYGKESNHRSQWATVGHTHTHTKLIV